MITEYITIHGYYQGDFDRTINARLKMGWELFGFQTTHATPSGMIYIQVMVKVEKEKNDI